MKFNPVAYQKQLRKLHRTGKLTAHQYLVADAMLWSLRAPGRDELQVSYRRIKETARVAYSVAVEAVAALVRLGVMTKTKTRLRVRWALGVAVRQGRNIYRLISAPASESAAQPTYRMQGSSTADSGPVPAKQAASGRKWWALEASGGDAESVARQLAALRGG